MPLTVAYDVHPREYAAEEPKTLAETFVRAVQRSKKVYHLPFSEGQLVKIEVRTIVN